MGDLFFSKDTNEPAEPLNGATDGFLIEQPASGGVRRQKWLFLDGLRDWLSTAFSNLAVSILTVNGNITQTAGATSLKATTIVGVLTLDDTVGITAPTTIRLKKATTITGQLALTPPTRTYLDGLTFKDPLNPNIWGIKTGGGVLSFGYALGSYTPLEGDFTDALSIASASFTITSPTSYNPSGTWTATSDREMKENIRNISNPIEKIKALSECVKQYKFKEGVNSLKGLRTQYIAQELQERGFSGHVTESEPVNEVQGEILGWEYSDEEYYEDEPMMETITKYTPTIIDGKIVKVPSKEEVQKTELKTVQEIQNKKGTDELIIVDVEKQVPVFKSVRKTKRVVVKKGRMMLQVEQNLSPYFAPAIAENSKDIEAIKKHIGMV